MYVFNVFAFANFAETTHVVAALYMVCVCGQTPDVVIYSKFHRNPFRSFGGGRNLVIPITLAIVS